MSVFSFQSISFRSLHVRWFVGIIVWLIILWFAEFRVLIHHPAYIFFLYALPYLFYYTVCFLIFHNIWRHGYGKWLVLLPCMVLLLTVYDIVKLYLYDLLPSWDVVFFYPWKEGDEQKLMRKIVRGLLLATIYLLVDHLISRIRVNGTETQQLQRTLDNISNSNLLSGHFLRRLFDMAVQGKIAFDLKVMDFFQYVINKMALRDTLVSLDEEWRYLRQLIEMSVHHRFEIKGVENIPAWLWNRSVPTLTLMTWIENATEYSAKNQLILLEWTVMEHAVILRICNRMDRECVSRGTGRGLDLVNRLYEPLRHQGCTLQYRIEDEACFVVELKFDK